MDKLAQSPVTVHTVRNPEGAERQLAHMVAIIKRWQAKKAEAGAA